MGEEDTCTVNLLHSVKNTKCNVYGTVGYRMIPPCSRSRYGGNCSPCFVYINSLNPTSLPCDRHYYYGHFTEIPTEVQRPSCSQAYWGPNCQINPDPGILAPVHTVNYDTSTSIHVAFQNRKIFFFFRVDFWSTWVLARGVGKEETWRQDMVRSLVGVVGPTVQGDRVEAEQSRGEMRLHGEKGTSVWSSFVAYWVLDPRPGVFPAKEKLLWLHGRQSVHHGDTARWNLGQGT